MTDREIELRPAVVDDEMVRRFLRAFQNTPGDEALLRQALKALGRAHQTAMEQTLEARIPECAEFAGIAQDLDFVVAAMRDYFAAKAMQSLLATIDTYPDEHWRDGLARDAYMMADAMLRAREASND